MYNRSLDYPPYNLRDFPRRDYSMYKPVRLKTDWRKKHSKPHHLYLKHKFTDHNRVGAEFTPPPIVIKPYDRPTILQGKGTDFIEGEHDEHYLNRVVPRLNYLFTNGAKYYKLYLDSYEAVRKEFGYLAANSDKKSNVYYRLFMSFCEENIRFIKQIKKEHPNYLNANISLIFI